jgi:uncharacterized protein
MTDLETVSRLYELLEVRDFEGVLALASDDCVLTQDESLPWGGRYVGHGGAASFVAALYGTIKSDLTIQALFEDAGQIIQIGRIRGTVLANGAAFDLPEIHAWTVKDGKVATGHFAYDTTIMAQAIAATS